LLHQAQLNFPFAVWVLCCIFPVITDARTRLLPNRQLLVGLAASWIALFVQVMFFNLQINLGFVLLLTVVAFLLFATFAFLGKGAFGFGDAKFAALAYLLPACFSFQTWFLAVTFSFVTGSVAGIIKIFCRRSTMNSKLAFGPYMFLGALISLIL
jgi:leader peptidase (prepilin peptidase)/N-methyltransferase